MRVCVAVPVGVTNDRVCPQVDQPTMGVGCTCTLQTTTPHRGDHRCFVSVWSPLLRRQYSLTLSKGTRTREEEDTIVSYLVLLSMAEAAALSLPAAAFAGLLDALGVTYGTWIVALSLARVSRPLLVCLLQPAHLLPEGRPPQRTPCS